MKRMWFTLMTLFLVPMAALAVSGIGENPLVIPGTYLGWESSKLELVLRVQEEAQIKLDVYSPGFDPQDYRSPEELGDERYDRRDTLLRTRIRVLDTQGEVKLQREYGVEPHRWHNLINSALPPGDYLIQMLFFGNGKNALVFKLTADPQKATLEVAPNSMQTYNVHGPDWQYPFAITKRDWTAPIRVGIYDGDGPNELLIHVLEPGGVRRNLPAPGNRQWTQYQVSHVGEYKFGFKQPETAKQYTNTVGFKVFLGPVKVNIVDQQGNPVKGAEYRVSGYYDRVVELTTIPPGWELVNVVPHFGRQLTDRQVLFGPGGGDVTYILRPRRVVLHIHASAVCGDQRWPVPLELRVGERRVVLNRAGFAELSLPPGEFPLLLNVPGATIDAPAKIQLSSDREAKLELLVRPQLKVDLTLNPNQISLGQKAVAQATISTEFPYTIPSVLRIVVPEKVELLGNPAAVANISSDQAYTHRVKLKANSVGRYTIKAISQPCTASDEEQLIVQPPAKFQIIKTTTTPTVLPGDVARFKVMVTNKGAQSARVRLLDKLPPGLEGQTLDELITLRPGESYHVELSGKVRAQSGVLTNTARIFTAEGALIGQASASVKVANVRLSRTLDKHIVVPGELVKVCLQVGNKGSVVVDYELVDEYPDWLEPQRSVRFQGQIQPGEMHEHCYTAKVRFGPEQEGEFIARLTSNAGNLTATDHIKRVLLRLEKSVRPSRIIIGDEAEFQITLTNPTDHVLSARLLDSPAAGLGIEPREEYVELNPGESRSFRYRVKPHSVGKLLNRASVFINDTPASFSVKAVLEVLPKIKARRISEIKLSFNVEGPGESLLIAHTPPEGSEYRPGSSRLDGKPISEPRVDDQGRLIWKVPYEPAGTLSYTVEHEGALPPLDRPELTLLTGRHQLKLAGDVSLEDYEKASPVDLRARDGLIKEPLPGTVFRDVDSTKIRIVAPYGKEVKVQVNGVPVTRERLGKAQYDPASNTQTLEYYGVPLKVGSNLVTVEAGDLHDQIRIYRTGKPVDLVAIPEEAVADGFSPIRVRIESRDDNGFATGMGFVTIESNIEPMEADANPKMSGYQILMRDGVAKLTLRPMNSPGEVVLRYAKDEIERLATFYVPGPRNSLIALQGSITARLGTGLEVGGRARGYLEAPFADGTIQGALGVNGGIAPSAFYYHSDLLSKENPNGRYPLTGSGEQSGLPLESDDGIAIKYDTRDFSLGYYKTSLSLPGLEDLPRATALVARTRGDLVAGAFVALLPKDRVLDVIIPDGTRIYKLSNPVQRGTDKVVLRVGAVENELVPLRDYVIDYPSGHITLAKPLWPNDANLVPVRLLVSYAPETAPRNALAFGAGASYKVGPFTVGAAAASMDSGATWKYGAMLGYSWGPFSASVSLSSPSTGGEWNYSISSAYISKTLRIDLRYSPGAKGVAAIAASGRQGRLSMAGNLRYDGNLSGKLRAAVEMGNSGKIVFEHRGSKTSNRSALLYEQNMGSLQIGLGAGYEWQTASPSAVGRVGYNSRKLRVTATHRHSFSVAPSLTTLGFSYAFDQNLRGAGELAYEWGAGLSGTFAFYQTLGLANLSISYALPNADGDGNRARFGVHAPLPLNDKITLDFSAGYERDFSEGDYQAAAGTSVRYHDEKLAASFGVEAAIGSAGSKLTLRAGAAGKLSEQQVLSFDANYIHETTWHGRFTLAYAYRGEILQILTYHRIINEAATSFEGEIAPTWHPSLSFQVRPSAAYRVSLSDPESSLYQVGLAANYYFNSRFGFGGGAYYVWQPSLPKSYLSFSVEGSLRLMDPVWLNLGYTFGGFNGLTPESRPGIYLRLDFSTFSGFHPAETSAR